MGSDEAFTLSANSINNTHHTALAMDPSIRSKSQYASLDKIQCQIFFDPFAFLVSVNTTSGTMDVTPQNEIDDALINSGNMGMNVIFKLGMLSGVLKMAQWTSMVGDTLTNNIANVSRLNGTHNQTTLHGVGTAVESIIDNTLEACLAAQMLVLSGLQKSSAVVKTRSYVLGNPRYTYRIPSVNISVSVISIAEAPRTRWWKGAPRFDFVDLKAVILNAGNNSAINEAITSVKLVSGGKGTRLSVSKDLPDYQHPEVPLLDSSHASHRSFESGDYSFAQPLGTELPKDWDFAYADGFNKSYTEKKPTNVLRCKVMMIFIQYAWIVG